LSRPPSVTPISVTPQGAHPGSPGEDDARLERVMREVPHGALALAAVAVGLLMIAWILIYLFVFLPRGTVG
jgi:hypothetical protein